MDAQGVGPSNLIPRHDGEDFKDRHSRRLRSNLPHEEELREFANSRGITFTVKNKGHHWAFKRGNERLEWWPSTAKLVKNQKWKQGLHVYDHQQVLTLLRNFFPEQKLPTKPRNIWRILLKWLHLAKDEV